MSFQGKTAREIVELVKSSGDRQQARDAVAFLRQRATSARTVASRKSSAKYAAELTNWGVATFTASPLPAAEVAPVAKTEKQLGRMTKAQLIAMLTA